MHIQNSMAAIINLNQAAMLSDLLILMLLHLIIVMALILPIQDVILFIMYLILEIHLISAQGLKAPSANLRRMQTYALAWVDSSAKLRTGVDRFGGENPTWNDKFLFQISPDFISSETSGVTFELYAVACIKDVLVGSVRFLLSSCPTASAAGTPAFIAAQIQRPSGRFHGVLNIGAAVYKATKFDRAMMNGVSATSFRDLMGKKKENQNLLRRHRRLSDIGSKRTTHRSSNSSSSSFSSSSSNSNSSSSAAAVDKDAENKELGSDGGGGGAGLLCGLMMQRRFSFCPLDQNMMRIADWAETLEKKQ